MNEDEKTDGDSNEKSPPTSIRSNVNKENNNASIHETDIATKDLSSTLAPVSSVKSSDVINVSTALKSPQSPISKGCHSKVHVESDLSSDDEFECIDDDDAKFEMQSNKPSSRHRPSIRRTKQSKEVAPTSTKPTTEPDCMIPTSKKIRLVPKQYQVEEEATRQKRGLSRKQEYKESSQFEKRHPIARSPSPHGHYRRYHAPSSSQYGSKHSYQHKRPPSPGANTQHQGFCSPSGSPGSPARRHYSTSPPQPRYMVLITCGICKGS